MCWPTMRRASRLSSALSASLRSRTKGRLTARAPAEKPEYIRRCRPPGLSVADGCRLLDRWSRRVVGYAIGKRIDARLALAALRAAIAARRPPPGCIHHSDRGSQYAAEDYRTELAKHGLKGSMGRRGNPYDNAKAESFIKTLKVEEVYLMEWMYSRFSAGERAARPPLKIRSRAQACRQGAREPRCAPHSRPAHRRRPCRCRARQPRTWRPRF